MLLVSPAYHLFGYTNVYEDNLNQLVSNICPQIHFKYSSTVDKPYVMFILSRRNELNSAMKSLKVQKEKPNNTKTSTIVN